MAISLKIWTKDDAARIYIGTRYAERRFMDADGAYFQADENGKVHVSFQRSMSGVYGEAAFAVMEYFGITRDMEFSDLLDRVRNSKGPRGGSFNEDAFFRQMEAA